jgi:hypothetical protein
MCLRALVTVVTYRRTDPIALSEVSVSPPVGRLIRECFGIIAEIRVWYVEYFGVRARVPHGDASWAAQTPQSMTMLRLAHGPTDVIVSLLID